MQDGPQPLSSSHTITQGSERAVPSALCPFRETEGVHRRCRTAHNLFFARSGSLPSSWNKHLRNNLYMRSIIALGVGCGLFKILLESGNFYLLRQEFLLRAQQGSKNKALREPITLLCALDLEWPLSSLTSYSE